MFNFTINYNKPQNGATPLFNGNISETSWNTLNVDTSTRGYKYSYDALNRITAATGDAGGNYNVSGITYDKNGNIQSLNRNGWQNSATFTDMDKLVYWYGNGNRLNYVTDGGNNNYGFKDGNKVGNDYDYDANGNMIKDLNKNITSITYNHLNLPLEIKVNNSDSQKINYTYDAIGTKLRKVINDNGNITTLDYDNGYTYENDELQYFPTEEGYVKKDNTGFKYVYQYKDHLGNVRLSYTDNNNDGIIQTSGTSSEIIEENHFYPFGLKHKGYNGNVSSIGNSVAQKFKFNGKEFEQSLGLNLYEYGARMYDPSTALFTSIDPKADVYSNQSPYIYAANNPIFYEEKNGEFPLPPGWKKFARAALNYLGDATKGSSVSQLYVGWMSAGVESLSDTQTDSEDYANRTATGIAQAMDGDYKSAAINLNVEGAGDMAAMNTTVQAAKNGDMQAAGGLAYTATAAVASVVTPAKSKGKLSGPKVKTITIDAKKHPQSATHLREAMNAGKPNVGVVDRAGASKRRRAHLKGTKTKKGMDRDEAPPAVINTGQAASVKLINSSDNRGAGSSIGHQLRGVKNGTQVRIIPINEN
ncbi:RHS repeat-associated core domain-containing protein [Tenacibaculum discolor]|uniref:RHS repeat-associated core domain-containing protein n=1 Tax=Tenacibaculum discolor TaxID=361581 RepID=UPI000EAE903C|nr:RHS repeat-associated core domain-containing protein [Tenacibaculum discolor]RLJ99619.1 RHS repeat-associated protein [Tenacibaculum discolor]